MGGWISDVVCFSRSSIKQSWTEFKSENEEQQYNSKTDLDFCIIKHQHIWFYSVFSQPDLVEKVCHASKLTHLVSQIFYKYLFYFAFLVAATAAAKSLQSCPTLCDPIDGSPPGSPILGVLQARTLEWVAISFSNAWKWKVKVKSLSRVRLLATPRTATYQAPPSMGFSRQEYWSGVPLPSPICTLLGTIPVCRSGSNS